MPEKKKMGVICPIGDEGDSIRKQSDDVLHAIESVAQELKYEKPKRADREHSSSLIDNNILKLLMDSDIVIADLTNSNPNVYYELGIRQALKGKTVLIISKKWCEETKRNNRPLPFDINHYNVIKYDTEGFEATDKFKAELKDAVLSREKEAFKPLRKMDPQYFVTDWEQTIVTDFRQGDKDQYELAEKLFSVPCKTIFLAQRSSSLVLNAEQGWEAEESFIKHIRDAVNKCDHFYHIVSLEGIKAHIERENSVFPDFTKENIGKILQEESGSVKIRTENSKNRFYLKKLPIDQQNTLFKSDRQARVMIRETRDGEVTAVLVQNLGETQTTFQISGPKAKEYLNACVHFYHRCDNLCWKDIMILVEEYERIREARRGGIIKSE